MMNVKRWLCVLAAAPMGLVAAGSLSGCDEHPRSGQVENERVTEGEDAGRRGKEQAGAQGSELVAHTEGAMDECVKILEQVMRCTSQQPFIDALASPAAGLSEEKLGHLAQYWDKSGTRRQSCRQIFQQQGGGPFSEPEKLRELAEATDQQCVDFAAVLDKAGAVDTIGDVDVSD